MENRTPPPPAAATPGHAALGDVSNYQMIASVTDKYGKRIEVGRTDTETVLIPPPGIGALFFDAAQHERFQAAIAAPQPVPEVRTCYCGTTATVVPGTFPHPDCDGSVPQPAPELAADTDRLRKALESVFAVLDRQTRTYSERISYARTLIRTALEGKP